MREWAILQFQLGQTLICLDVPLTSLGDQFRGEVRRPWRRQTRLSRLFQTLLVSYLGEPVPDELLVIAFLSLARGIVRLRPDPKLVRANGVSQENVLFFVKAELE